MENWLPAVVRVNRVLYENKCVIAQSQTRTVRSFFVIMQGNERKSHHLSIAEKRSRAWAGYGQRNWASERRLESRAKFRRTMAWASIVQAAGVSGPVQELFNCMTRWRTLAWCQQQFSKTDWYQYSRFIIIIIIILITPPNVARDCCHDWKVMRLRSYESMGGWSGELVWISMHH